MARNRLTLLMLAFVAVGSGWLAWIQPELEPLPAGQQNTDLPDYYLGGLSLTHYGPDGAQLRTLKAVRVEHYPDKGSLLTRPRLTQYNAEGSPWQVEAEQGQANPGNTLLTFPGAVEISRLATPANRPLTLQTRDLRVNQGAGYAETDEAVTVTSDRTRVTAVGLKAWLGTAGHIQLLSQVKAHYEP